MKKNAIMRMIIKYGLLMMAFPSLSMGMASGLKNNDKYRFTKHSIIRIIERNISPEDVLGTIKNGIRHDSKNTRLYVDNKTEMCVVVSPKSNLIITAYRKLNRPKQQFNKPKQNLYDDFDVNSQDNIKELKSIYCSLLKLSRKPSRTENDNNQSKKLKKEFSEIKKKNVTREEFRQARLSSRLRSKKANELLHSKTYQSNKIKTKKCTRLDKLINEAKYFNYYAEPKTGKEIDNEPLNQGNYEKKSKRRPITLAEYFPEKETE